MRLFIVVLTIFFAGCKSDKKVWSGKDSWKERRLRSIVEEKYSHLPWGFYQFSGSTIIGVLEDFDNERVLLFAPHCYPDTVKILHNGEELTAPFGKIEVIRMGEVSADFDSDEITYEDDFSRENDFEIGFWLQLKTTDRLQISLTFEHTNSGVFEASYDPDHRWRVNSSEGAGKKGRIDPSDVYDLSKGSMLAEVRSVLERKRNCRIRFTEMGEAYVTVTRWKESAGAEAIKPIILNLNLGHVEIGQVGMDLSIYSDGARAAGQAPRVCLEVGPMTEDEVFREVLKKISHNSIGKPVELKWLEE